VEVHVGHEEGRLPGQGQGGEPQTREEGEELVQDQEDLQDLHQEQAEDEETLEEQPVVKATGQQHHHHRSTPSGL